MQKRSPRKPVTNLAPLPARAERFGMVAGEATHLKRATARAIEGLSDRQLAFVGQQLWRFVGERAAILGIDLQEWREPERPSDYPIILRTIAARLGGGAHRRTRTALDKRLSWIGNVLGLNRTELAVLGVFARTIVFRSWQELTAAIPFQAEGVAVPTIALLAGVGADAVEERLAHGTPLLAAGLIKDDCDGEYSPGPFLRRIARAIATDPDTLARRMTPSAPPSTLEWDDFAHIADRDLALALLRSGAPVSILLHGRPGTGKTEFARALADRLERHALFAGMIDEAGGEPTREERLGHLAILRALTRDDVSRFVVVDEADDVLRLADDSNHRRHGSKLWLNRLVETPETPTIWITNDADALDEAIVRRMHLAMRFDLPPPRVRARIVARTSDAVGLSVVPAGAARIAALPASPAVLASAVATARLAHTDEAAALRVGASILDALGDLTRPLITPAEHYDPALAQADHDLAALAARFAESPSRDWSLLLGGPPGTGKSAWARYLATQLGIEVSEKRGADLLSPYVGQTEANIARAFRDAGERGELLLIDEADTFLFDRQGATRSWESSMVNEMLRWMEHHPAPFIATTNRADTLDAATQRRFTITVQFEPLAPARAHKLFADVFGMPLPLEASPLEEVTPGDISVVAKRARLLGETNPSRLAEWVRNEVEARGGRTGTGFHRPLSFALK